MRSTSAVQAAGRLVTDLDGLGRLGLLPRTRIWRLCRSGSLQARSPGVAADLGQLRQAEVGAHLPLRLLGGKHRKSWSVAAPPEENARTAAVLHGGEACVTISMSRAERADLGQRGAQPGAARRRTHGDERTTVPVDTAEGGQVVRLAHLLRLNPPDGRSSHIEWQPEGHRRL